MLRPKYSFMKNNTLRIATRKSPLALAQTHLVKQKIAAIAPELHIELLPLQTTGDKFLNQSLSKIGGKGLFVKELQKAILAHEADLAVHSMKDVPHELPDELAITAILARENPQDALVGRTASTLQTLPYQATIGTSSLRRASQLCALRPDFVIKPLRGNINTRLSKLAEFDAIVLAAAGLTRMDFQARATELLPTDQVIPAAGQGALGIECRTTDNVLIKLLSQLNCPQTSLCVLTERKIIEALNGSCQVPIAAHAYLADANTLKLSACVGTQDGSVMLYAREQAPVAASDELAQRVILKLKEQGADSIISQYS